ncbi:ABC transporter ATP-binding protein [Fulvimarina pelagi HTCC2506]|uniref:ABC transporter ATP-binding protein n=1 Tax=Fulvimarina pelagi HTCC2506 TaxID=314231 RepID=Q0FXG4_9HYPH|nr:sn-glycerol-3-phosphate ABC transporter ATP-binding protein UgpC [Fulvimarina pelagi]EAU39686.1 ABC transporter ATP-binding protein [Fulvimarina pelagi HTCC2506]
MSKVEFKNAQKAFGAVKVIEGLSLEIPHGSFAVLLGPSGCGKSTLLRMIAGLEKLTGGEVAIAGKRVNDVHPRDRDIAMVFQNYALYPTMKVRENIAFNLEIQKLEKREIERRVSEAADILNLRPFLDRYPKELSGGQRQRVAMGRALVREAGVFLFDEPLSNLDAKLRAHMRVEIRQLHERLGATTLYVTHDQIEAMTMADIIVLLDKGAIVQVGTPDEVYEKPNSVYVADFIGSPSMNFFDGEIEADGEEVRFRAANLSIPLEARYRGQAGKSVKLGVRPNDLHFAADGAFKGEVILSETTGAEVQIHVRIRDSDVVAVAPRTERRVHGEAVALSVPPGKVHIFDAQSERRIEPQ